MTTPAGPPAVQLYCTRCGRPAPLHSRTIDPKHPLVSCHHGETPGIDDPPSIDIGTADPDEAEGVSRERRRVRATANHHWHKRNGKANPDCDECRTDPPKIEVKAHEYEPFRTKFRIASHLELVHHNRELLPKITLRSQAELDEHHRRLHG